MGKCLHSKPRRMVRRVPKVYMLYRAGPDTTEHPIYFGLAESSDGFRFTKSDTNPVFGPRKRF